MFDEDGWATLRYSTQWQYFDEVDKCWVDSQDLGTVLEDARANGGRYRAKVSRVQQKEWSIEDE